MSSAAVVISGLKVKLKMNFISVKNNRKKLALYVVDIWGFDDQAVSVLQSMKPQDLETLVTKYSILLDSSSELLPQNTKEGVSRNCKELVFFCFFLNVE